MSNTERFNLAQTDQSQTASSRAWQPIETAPKEDGVLVLLYPSRCWADDVNSDCEVGYWDDFVQRWLAATTAAEDYTGPTHWMPLPLPPGATPDVSSAEERPCLKRFVTCDADEGGPETWCANCRARAEERPHRQDGWQPIETAPSDGHWFWVSFGRRKPPRVCQARWCPDNGMWQTGTGYWHTLSDPFTAWHPMRERAPEPPPRSEEPKP